MVTVRRIASGTSPQRKEASTYFEARALFLDVHGCTAARFLVPRDESCALDECRDGAGASAESRSGDDFHGVSPYKVWLLISWTQP